MSTDPEFDQAVATKVARAELMKRVLIVAIAFLVSIILVLAYRTLNTTKTAVKEIRATQETGSPVLKAIIAQQEDIGTAATASTQLLALILDCFDPESECSKKSAAHEAEQAGADLAANVATAYCRDQVMPETYTYAELFACVGDQLDGKDKP